MISAEYIGIIGAVILILSWVYETAEGLKEHKELIDLRFAVANISAIVILIAYSWMIKNDIFFWLNIVLAIVVAAEIGYTLAVKKKLI